MIRIKQTAVLILTLGLVFTGIFGGCGGNSTALQPVSNQDNSSDIQSPVDESADNSQSGENPAVSDTGKGISFKWEEGDSAAGIAKSCIDYDKDYPGVEMARASVGGIAVDSCTADIYAGYVGKCTFVEDKEFTNTIYYYSNYTAVIARSICASLKGTWVSAE